MFITGIAVGIIISITIIGVFAPRFLFTVSESKFDFLKTKETIEKATSENKWSMPHQYDLQGIMTKNGFSVNPVTVFSICKPNLAALILENDNDQHISALMPCRIAIFEKGDGKTYVSRMNVNLFSKLLGTRAKAIMGDAGDGSEKIVAQLIK